MTSKTIADDIALIAIKQITTSQNFKQPRMVEILDNEDVYNFKLRPALQGRLNIPFDGVVMAGFIDTLVAQVNRPPRIEFQDDTGANLKGARKITSAFERDHKKFRLKLKDRVMKKIAAIAGRSIAKYYAESDPKYCPYLDIVDYLDFHCEPNGGGHLDDHYFHWQENIFRSKEDLIKGGKSGWYEPKQVDYLIANYASPDFKKNTDTFNNKNSRYATLGLDMLTNNYIGGTLFNLVEGDTFYQGMKYHLIFDRNTGIWLRCVPLVEDFGNDLTPFISFASPQEDAFNFWNRGPADQIKPIAESIRVNLNEILNNNRKRNWDMKAVDSNVFPDIRKLDWRQDGIVSANVPLGQSIQNGIYRFETPEITGALNLNTYLNNLAGEKLGINSQTQGQGSEDLATIYKGNQLMVSMRMRLLSDSYEEMYEDLGKRYDWGLYDHANEDEMVKLISTDGIGWEKITTEDKDPEYVVSVISAIGDMAETDQEKRVKLDALVSTETNPALFVLVNPKAHLEEKYKLSGYDDEKIKKLLNTKEDTTDELLSEAKKAIEMILEGKKVKLNFSATTGYLQYISDWILDNSDDLEPEKKAELEAYFEKHIPIAIKNKEQQAFVEQLTAGTLPPLETPTASPTGAEIPTNTPALPMQNPAPMPLPLPTNMPMK
jgi:hypothetical protein